MSLSSHCLVFSSYSAWHLTCATRPRPSSASWWMFAVLDFASVYLYDIFGGQPQQGRAQEAPPPPLYPPAWARPRPQPGQMPVWCLHVGLSWPPGKQQRGVPLSSKVYAIKDFPVLHTGPSGICRHDQILPPVSTLRCQDPASSLPSPLRQSSVAHLRVDMGEYGLIHRCQSRPFPGHHAVPLATGSQDLPDTDVSKKILHADCIQLEWKQLHHICICIPSITCNFSLLHPKLKMSSLCKGNVIWKKMSR